MIKKSIQFNKLSDREVQRIRRWMWVFVILGLITVFAGLEKYYKQYNPDLPYKEAQKNSKDPMSVVRHVRINGVDLWIPMAYFHSRIPSQLEENSVLLITLYPDFEPLKEKQQKIWEKGEWYRNVRWLIQNPVGKKNVREIFSSFSSSFNATEYQRSEYGLKYYSQPEEIKNDGGDIWIEGDALAPKSLIWCGKKLGNRSFPQCRLYEQDSSLFYNISFDKKLLPHWQEIKDSTLSLTEKFKRSPNSQPSSSMNQTGD